MSRNSSDGMVVVAVKTPMMPRPTTARMPGRLTAAQALEALRKIPPKDATATRVLQQLARETAGQHDFLVVTTTGQTVKIDPHHATIEELAVPREIRVSDGMETVPIAAFEVQAYAPVGS
jgi:hypothetical protein